MRCKMRSFEISMEYKRPCGVRRNETRGGRDSESFGGYSIGIIDEQSTGDRLRIEAARSQRMEDRSLSVSRWRRNTEEQSGRGHEISTSFEAGTGDGLSYGHGSI